MNQDKLVRRMFLILHDPFTGKPQIGHDLLRTGLVAAELAALTMARHIGMENDCIVVAETRGTESDEIDSFVVEGIQRQDSAHTVRSWVDALGETVYDMVARTLLAEGTVRRVQGGRRLVGRSPDRFPALDLMRAAGPRLRLEHMLRTPHERDLAAAVTAAVLGALKVERVLDVDRDRATVKASVAAAASALPVDLRSLVAGVEASGAATSAVTHGSAIGPMRRERRST